MTSNTLQILRPRDVIDLSGTSGTSRIARVWQLTASGRAVKQTVTVQDGLVTFTGILGTARQSFGITIEEADHPTVNGPDFRSGPLPTIVDPEGGDPAKRVEIVVLNPIAVTGDALCQAVPPLPIQLSFPAGPVGTIDTAVNSLQFVINKGDLSLSESGTASAAVRVAFVLRPDARRSRGPSRPRKPNGPWADIGDAAAYAFGWLRRGTDHAYRKAPLSLRLEAAATVTTD